jgi:hypothetical protein
MNIQQIRSWLIKALLGTLVVAATIAVVAILIGELNDTVWRAVGTVLSAMIHIGIVFTVISLGVGKNPATKRSTDLVVNSAMIIAVLSFFTSVFGIWDLLDSELAAKLYLTYAVVLFALLHVKTLMDVEAVYSGVKSYILANYVLIVAVASMILLVIHIPSGWDLLSGFFGRLLAALAIIDATLSVSIAVMHRLYLQKHPELATQTAHHDPNVSGRIIVAILLFVFVVWPMLSMLISFSRW